MSSFFSNSIYSIIQKVLSVILSFLTLMLIARALGPEGQGKYSLLTSLSRTFLYFLSFGLNVGLVYSFGKDKSERQNISKTYFILILSLAGIAFVSSQLFMYTFQSSVFKNINQGSLLVASISVGVWFFNSYSSSILSGLEKFKDIAIANFLQSLMLTCGIIVLWATDSLFLSSGIGIFLTSLIFLLFYNLYVLYKSDFRVNFFKSQFKKSILVNNLNYSLKSYLGSITEFLIYRVDIYFIAYFLSKLELGVYVIAVNLVERIWIFSESLERILFSKLVNMESEQEKKNKISILVIKTNFMISLGCGFFLAVVSDLFIRVFFGDEYSGSVFYVYVLLPGVILQGTSRIFKKILEANSYTGTNAKAAILCMCLNIVLNLLLIPKLGAMGAAVASTIAYTIYFVSLLIGLKAKLNIKIRSVVFLSITDLRTVWDFLKTRKLDKN